MIKHRYAHEIDPNGGSAAAVLARMVEPGQRVLELGTGPGTVTRILHSKGCKVTGVEMDAETLATCAPFCDRTLQANLEDPEWATPLAGETFDAIICADVLEHLRDPRPLLLQLPAFLKTGGNVLMSLPNASHLTVVASLLSGRFPYQKNGLLDHTHLKFYGREDLESLLRECGFLWQHWHTVQVDPAQAELKAYWHLLPEADQAFLKAKCADGDVYQHVVRAQPALEAAHLQRLEHDRLVMLKAHESQALQLSDSLKEALKLRAEAEEHAREIKAEVDLQVLKMQSSFDSNVLQLKAESDAQLLQLKAESDAQLLHLQSQFEAQKTAWLIEKDTAAAHHSAQVNSLLVDIQNSQASLAWTEAQLQNHKQSIQELRAEIESFKQSTSWRITAPLRKLLRKLS